MESLRLLAASVCALIPDLVADGEGDPREAMQSLVPKVGECILSPGSWGHCLVDSQRVALPLSVEVRMFRLAALLDLNLLDQLVVSELVQPCSEALSTRVGGGLPLALIQRTLADTPYLKQLTEAMRQVTEGG